MTAVEWQLTFTIGSWVQHCVEMAGDWLLHWFDVRLYEDRGHSLPLQSGGKEQSDSDHKEH